MEVAEGYVVGETYIIGRFAPDHYLVLHVWELESVVVVCPLHDLYLQPHV